MLRPSLAAVLLGVQAAAIWVPSPNTSDARFNAWLKDEARAWAALKAAQRPAPEDAEVRLALVGDSVTRNIALSLCFALGARPGRMGKPGRRCKYVHYCRAPGANVSVVACVETRGPIASVEESLDEACDVPGARRLFATRESRCAADVVLFGTGGLHYLHLGGARPWPEAKVKAAARLPSVVSSGLGAIRARGACPVFHTLNAVCPAAFEGVFSEWYSWKRLSEYCRNFSAHHPQLLPSNPTHSGDGPIHALDASGSVVVTQETCPLFSLTDFGSRYVHDLELRAVALADAFRAQTQPHGRAVSATLVNPPGTAATAVRARIVGLGDHLPGHAVGTRVIDGFSITYGQCWASAHTDGRHYVPIIHHKVAALSSHVRECLASSPER